MGDRRKRKSLWDQEDETKHFSGMSGHYHEFSASGNFSVAKSRDNPGQPSWKSTEEIPVAQKHGGIFINSQKDAPQGKGMSGGNADFEDMSLGFADIEKHKYNEVLGNGRSNSRGGRSRSQSRSRTRGRSRSRSLSRGRGRSRSRSGSRSDGSARGKNRSRSPIGDYRRQSYGLSDKRGASDKSSQMSLQADSYHGRTEQFRSRSRNAFPCKDFIKGKCRWGDTCRWSHHSGYTGTFDNSTGYKSFNKDIDLEPHKNAKEICKYFAAGKCDRDNCRFSHEDPKYSSLEGRQSEMAKGYGSHDKIDQSSDAARISEKVKPVGHSSGNDQRRWGIPEWTDNSMKLVKPPSPPGEIGGYDRDIGTAESIGKENQANKQGYLTLYGSQLQNEEANAKVQGKNTVQEDLSAKAQEQQQNFSSALPIQQQGHGTRTSNLVTSLTPDVLGEEGNSINTTQSSLLSGQSLNQNVENSCSGLSLMLNETGSGQNQLYPNPTNTLMGNWNGPETHQIAPLNLEPQVQNHLKAVQMTVPSMLPNQRCINEQPLKTTDGESSHSRGMSIDSLGNAYLVNAANLQFNQATVSHEPIGPEQQSGRGINEHGEQGNEIKVGKSSPLCTVDKDPIKTEVGDPESLPKLKPVTLPANPEVDKSNPAIGNEGKGAQNNMESETLDGDGKVEEKSATKDDRTMRTLKNSLIEFVKDLLKPTWKEGKMSREVHKTIVKKVVEKVISTIQDDHIPKTQDKVDQYLLYSKTKISKLVQAYVARCLKVDPKS